jgi:hypothetical protein
MCLEQLPGTGIVPSLMSLELLVAVLQFTQQAQIFIVFGVDLMY